MIKVLVVDDSAFMRYFLRNSLVEDPDIQVVGVARDGLDALEKIPALRPDVITLDLQMPLMDGFATLKRIMTEFPLPVIILSTLTYDGADETIRALGLGAVDFVTKPSGGGTQGMRQDLVRKIKQVAGLNALKLKVGDVAPITASNKRQEKIRSRSCKGVVVIGASTGGPRALHQVVSRLPRSLSAGVLIVQHMPSGFTRSLAQRMDEVSVFTVREAVQGDMVQAGLALIAPGDYHMMVSTGGRIALDHGPTQHGVRPAMDVTLETVARVYGADTIGVILTGMGHDGTRGAARVKEAGGCIIAEEKSTCIVYGMPRSAVEAGVVDRVVPLDKVVDQIVALAETKHLVSAAAVS